MHHAHAPCAAACQPRSNSCAPLLRLPCCVQGSWRTRDALWICMEYCAGGSVSDIMHTCGSGLDEDM